MVDTNSIDSTSNISAFFHIFNLDPKGFVTLPPFVFKSTASTLIKQEPHANEAFMQITKVMAMEMKEEAASLWVVLGWAETQHQRWEIRRIRDVLENRCTRSRCHQ